MVSPYSGSSAETSDIVSSESAGSLQTEFVSQFMEHICIVPFKLNLVVVLNELLYSNPK